jgi:formylmethanofuran dehydrogenase subunit A
MTPQEITEQTARMVEGLDFRTSIGLHGDDIHTFGHNPTVIGAANISDNDDSIKVADRIRRTTTKPTFQK